MAHERVLREDGTGYIQLEDEQGSLLLESSDPPPPVATLWVFLVFLTVMTRLVALGVLVAQLR